MAGAETTALCLNILVLMDQIPSQPVLEEVLGLFCLVIALLL